MEPIYECNNQHPGLDSPLCIPCNLKLMCIPYDKAVSKDTEFDCGVEGRLFSRDCVYCSGDEKCNSLAWDIHKSIYSCDPDCPWCVCGICEDFVDTEEDHTTINYTLYHTSCIEDSHTDGKCIDGCPECGKENKMEVLDDLNDLIHGRGK